MKEGRGVGREMKESHGCARSLGCKRHGCGESPSWRLGSDRAAAWAKPGPLGDTMQRGGALAENVFSCSADIVRPRRTGAASSS